MGAVDPGALGLWSAVDPLNGGDTGQVLAPALLSATTVAEVLRTAAETLPVSLQSGAPVVGAVICTPTAGEAMVRLERTRGGLWGTSPAYLDRLLALLASRGSSLEGVLHGGPAVPATRLHDLLAPVVAEEEIEVLATAMGWGGGMVVPARADGQVVGAVLYVLSAVPLPEHEAVLEGATGLVGMALERAQRFDDERRRAVELEAIVEASGDASGLYDPAGQLVRANRAMEQLLGMPRQHDGTLPPRARAEALNVVALDGTPLAFEDHPTTKALHGEAARTHLRVVLPNGRHVAFDAAATPLYNDGVLTGAVLVLRTIDAELRQRQDLEALIAASQRLSAAIDQPAVLRAIVEAAADLVGADGAALAVSERRLGAASIGEELVYREWYRDRTWQLMGHERLPWEEVTERALATGEVQIVDNTPTAATEARDAAWHGLPLKDVADSSVLALPVRSRSGTVLAVVTLLLDGGKGARFGDEAVRLLRAFGEQAAVALENARLFEGERRARQDLEGAREQREAFVAMVAHELKNPLTAILGNGQLMERFFLRLSTGPTAEAVARAEHALSRILDNGRRLQTMVEDLQEALRLGSGRLELHLEECDAGSVIREVVDEQQTTTSNHRVVAEPAPDPVVGHWDGELLRRALVNLVSNAIKYSPQGGVVRVAVIPAGSRVQITVSDEGLGIPPDDMPSLFEPYSRLSRSARIKGTGLGLYIVKGIVEAHGGTVRADSGGAGQGATFTLTLPLGRDE